ncbi:hypothetical protein ACWC5G_33660, partial [Streptomyces sp. NPDC001274]
EVTAPDRGAGDVTVRIGASRGDFTGKQRSRPMTRGGPGESTQILVTQAYKFSFEISPRDFAQSSTWGVLILVLLMLFAVVYRRVLRTQGDNW